MKIRGFQAGDEVRQVAIYNAAAADLPKFKPASAQEVLRRTRAQDFDPASRFYAEENGEIVGYAAFNPNGRVSYPWCLKGSEHIAAPLFAHMLEAMRKRGVRRIFTAYRGDWPLIHDFFLQQGFRKVREMINYVIDLLELPTAPARPSSAMTPLERTDVPAVLAMIPEALRVTQPDALERHLFDNPYFTPESLFVLRSRVDQAPVAVGILITESTYADPRQVDSGMPCFRLGAFGTEGMQVKRIKGMFSFLAQKDQNIPGLGLDLLGLASVRLRDNDDIGTLGAQVASDVPILMQFYQRYFRRQGSFPVFERELS